MIHKIILRLILRLILRRITDEGQDGLDARRLADIAAPVLVLRVILSPNVTAPRHRLYVTAGDPEDASQLSQSPVITGEVQRTASWTFT